ncbi:MAG: sodium-dependent transporter [Bacillota bacterium]|nr:sodium-dependent transporter [Bacillota bacterium]
MSNNTETFASRWGYIAATLGMAIGTGNIWRFPREVAANGGGSFLLAWTIALFLWSVPLLMAEMVLGRKTGLGCSGAFRDFMGRKYTWMGTWVAAVCMLIAFYYSVVMGWSVKYITLGITGAFKAGMTPDQTKAIWDTFLNTPSQTLFFHLISAIIAGAIVLKGIKGGIEKACKIIIPAMFAMLGIMVVRALTLPGAVKGLEFMFTINPADLANPKVWLAAFTQSAWSTGAGWGFIIVYAVYTKRDYDIGVNCFITGLGDQTAALVAGLAVIPTIFALSPSLEAANAALGAGNTGLTFIYLSSLFPQMPMGNLMASIFFLALATAALSSLIAMVELGGRFFMDLGMERKKATVLMTVLIIALGAPSAIKPAILDNQDWVWGVALLISGLLCALAMMKYGLDKVRAEIINTPYADMYVGKWWNYTIMLFPVWFVLVFGWWVWQAMTWYPDNWMAPFETFSVGTMLWQWALLIVVALLANNYIADKTIKGRDITQEASAEGM